MRRQAGFTLLEVLVALVVLGFLVAGLAQGVRFGLRAWGMQTTQLSRTTDLDSVQRAVRRLIEEADPGEANEAGTFQGQGHTLAFRSRLPQGVGLPALRNCDVALGVDDRQQLVLRAAPHPHAERLGAPGLPLQTVLLTGVDHVDFEYFLANGRGVGWHSIWTDALPPALVRLHVAFAGLGTQRHWPDLVAAPRLLRQEE